MTPLLNKMEILINNLKNLKLKIIIKKRNLHKKEAQKVK